MKPESPSRPRMLVAILRGVSPTAVMSVADTLYAAGVRCIEVPLNSPDPFASIAALAARKPVDGLIGAGTVLSVDDVERAHAVGARLIVAPNCNPDVIGRSLRMGLAVMPGVATATEAFQAIEAGARELKLFPAASYGPGHLRALKSVLPGNVRVYPVGGIGATDIADWVAAGADGFGFGSEIFRPEYTLADIDARARRLVQTLGNA